MAAAKKQGAIVMVTIYLEAMRISVVVFVASGRLLGIWVTDGWKLTSEKDRC